MELVGTKHFKTRCKERQLSQKKIKIHKHLDNKYQLN